MSDIGSESIGDIGSEEVQDEKATQKPDNKAPLRVDDDLHNVNVDVTRSTALFAVGSETDLRIAGSAQKQPGKR